MLTNYQLSEITLGTIFYIPIYVIAYFTLNQKFDAYNIFITVILFFLWFYLTKISTNYFRFIATE